MADETVQDTQDTQDGDGGTGASDVDEQVAALVTEKLAELKAEQDKAFAALWDETKAAKADAKARSEELNKRLAELDEQRQAGKAGITSEQLEKLRADVRKNLDEEYAPHIEKAKTLEEQLAAATGKVRELQLDSRVKAQMGERGVRSDRIEKLFQLTRDQYGLTDDGVPMLKDEPTADIGKYISETLRSEYPEWFNGSGASGGGASRSAVGGGGKTVIPVGDGKAFIANLDKIASGEVEVR